MTYSLEEHEDQEEQKNFKHKEILAMRQLEDFTENHKNEADHVGFNKKEEHNWDGGELETGKTCLA